MKGFFTTVFFAQVKWVINSNVFYDSFNFNALKLSPTFRDVILCKTQPLFTTLVLHN